MLDNEARQNMQSIKELVIQNWGSDCEFADVRIVDSPYPEFELKIWLYHKIEVGIYYDRSALDIGIRHGEKFVLLGKFTAEQVYRGMKALKPENLLHNFRILDDVARELIKSCQG